MVEIEIASIPKKVASFAAKTLEKVALPRNSKKGPSLEILKEFSSDYSKMIYIGMYFLYHGGIRVFTLWAIYNWFSGVLPW